MPITKKIPYKRIAFAISVLLTVLWAVLGTGTSLAWFNDDTHEIKNVFNMASFEADVSYRLADGIYETIEGKTDIFDNEALYEPGYTQVVVLRVENKGTLPFHYQTAVYVHDYVPGYSVLQQTFLLQDYLRFGMVSAATEDALDALIATRGNAASITTGTLGDSISDPEPLAPGAAAYIALVVRMPEDVDNIANYCDGKQPKVVLGISVSATQSQ